MYQSTRCHQTRKIFENPLWEDVFKKPAQVLFDGMNNYTDYLGNVRVSYVLDPETDDLKILNENHYYPFGLKHQRYTNPFLRDVMANETETEKAVVNIDVSVENYYAYDYKYNYREWQGEFGLNWYSMDFKNYDPAIGRFHSPDPLGELTPDWTPYRFAFNNPVFFNDPTGLCEDCDFINFYYDGWETQSSFFENFFKGNWGVDINLDALATGDWSQEDMYESFGAEGYEYDLDNGNEFNEKEIQNPNPTISNTSDYTNHILDESNNNVYDLKPNNNYYGKFDGISMPHLYNDKVLKVTNGNSVVITNNDFNTSGKTFAHSIIQSIKGRLKDKSWLQSISKPDTVIIPDIGEVEVGKEKSYNKEHWGALFKTLGIEL